MICSAAVVALTETVQKNLRIFTPKEIEKARELYIVQGRFGHQSTAYFRQIVSQNDPKNCPILINDINNAHIIMVNTTQE